MVFWSACEHSIRAVYCAAKDRESRGSIKEGKSREQREVGAVRQKDTHALTGVLVSAYHALSSVGPAPQELFMEVCCLLSVMLASVFLPTCCMALLTTTILAYIKHTPPLHPTHTF